MHFSLLLNVYTHICILFLVYTCINNNMYVPSIGVGGLWCESVCSCSTASVQDALRGEHGRDFNGARIVVEWARGPKDTSAPRVRGLYM